MNQRLASLDLVKNPDKTFIGRIEKDFDFLGYHFSGAGLTIAIATVHNFVERATRLYEQEQRDPDGPPLLGQYVRGWLAAVRGLPDHLIATGFREIRRL